MSLSEHPNPTATWAAAARALLAEGGRVTRDAASLRRYRELLDGRR